MTLYKEIKQTLEQGINRNDILPLDWAMDRIEDVLKTYISNYILPKLKRIKELKEGCGVETKVYSKYKWYSKKYKIEICGKENCHCSDCKIKLQEQKKDIDDFKKQFGEELMPKEDLK